MQEPSDIELTGSVTDDLFAKDQVKETSARANTKLIRNRQSKISEKYLYRLAVIIPLSGLVCAGLLSLTAWSLIPDSSKLDPYGWKPFVHALVIFTLISGASFFSGGLLGFLFGFPRSSDIPDDKSTILKYQHNKNLEQISDWLIKMLIGIGLSQMNNFPGLIWHYASRLTEGITTLGNIVNERNVSTTPAPASCLILFFLICGFIEGYLATRLLLPSRLVEVDKESI